MTHVQRLAPTNRRTKHNCVSAPNCTDCDDEDDDSPKLRAAKRQAREIAINSAKSGFPREVEIVQIGDTDNYEIRSKAIPRVAVAA